VCRRAASTTSSEVPLDYGDFRTGLTFADVKAMLWSGDPDPSTWRYRRRHTVLGHWRQIKQQLYAEYLERWEQDRERHRRRRAA
jgi:hypothetical protein